MNKNGLIYILFTVAVREFMVICLLVLIVGRVLAMGKTVPSQIVNTSN